MQEGKVIVCGGLTNKYEKKKSERQGRKGKIYLTECRVPQNSRKREKGLLNEQCQETEENNRMGTTRDNIQENWRYQGNISCEVGRDKGQKQ